MPLDDSSTFTLNMLLPKSSRSAETRQAHKKNLESWLNEEKKTMPFDKMKSSKTQLYLMSKDFLFLVAFQRKTTIVFATKKPTQNLEKLNEVSNRICAYINAIMPQEVKEVIVSSEFENTQEGQRDFAGKVIGDARIARVSEILKNPWKPLALVFEWNTNKRHNIAMCGQFRKEEGLFLSSTYKWENSLPLDVVITEKNEFLKLQEMVSNILAGEM